MKRINLVYDDCYDDADILLVPDFVYHSAEKWPMQYGKYLMETGCHVMETEGFVEWLNQNVCINGELAQIIQQHVSVSASEKSIDF